MSPALATALWLITFFVTAILGVIACFFTLDASDWQSRLPERYLYGKNGDNDRPVWPFQIISTIFVLGCAIAANYGIFIWLEPFNGPFPWLYVVPSVPALAATLLVFFMSDTPVSTPIDDRTLERIAFSLFIGAILWFVIYGIMSLFGF